MREIACDVTVIGAGSAGIGAHRAAREAGANAVLIEQGPGGTTCARVGCMPSKLVIAAASAAHGARNAKQFGIAVGSVHVDGRAVMERVRALRDGFVGSVFETLDALPEGSRIAGRAAFESADTLVIGDHTRLRFQAAVLATGSSPSVPDALEPVRERVLTTDTVFEIAELPRSIAVLGGGAVGLELAQAMARLDVATTLFDPAGRIGGVSDPDLAQAARTIFGREIELLIGATVDGAESDGEGVILHWSGENAPRTSRRFDAVLAAAGRGPNLHGLGLERTGLRLDEKGMPDFDARSQLCGGAPIFLAGDVNRDRPVLHEASRQGRIAGRNAAALARGSDIERPERWVDLAMVFTHPQIARIGQLGDGADRINGRMSFCDQGRARVMGEAQGGMRIHADRSGRLLGAEMIGPDVEHLAQLLAYAIQDGHTAQSLRDRPFYHPTLEEGLETALSDIARQAEA